MLLFDPMVRRYAYNDAVLAGFAITAREASKVGHRKETPEQRLVRRVSFGFPCLWWSTQQKSLIDLLSPFFGGIDSSKMPHHPTN